MIVFNVALIVALVTKFTDFLRYLTSVGTAKGRNGVVTQLTAWAGGVAAVFLVAQSTFMDNTEIVQGHTLGSFNGAALVLFGVMVGSGGSFVKDFVTGVAKGDSVPWLTDTSSAPADLPPHGD